MKGFLTRYRKSISPPYTHKKDYLTLGITLIIVFFLPFLVWFLNQQTNLSQFASQLPANPMSEQNAKHNKLVAESQHITGATNFLLAIAAEVPKKKNDPTFVKQLVQTSLERKQNIEDMLDSDPQSILSEIVQEQTIHDTLSQVPGIALEQPISLTGTFTYLHQDDFQNEANDAYIPQLVTPNGSVYTLYSGSTIHGKPGSTVTIHGYQFDKKVLLPTTDAASFTEGTTTGTKVLGATIGPVKAVILVGNFTNTAVQVDETKLQNVFQGSPGSDVDSYFAQASYGKSPLTQDIYGPYTLPYSSSTGCNNTSQAVQDLMNLANVDVNFLNYTRIIYVFNDCSFIPSTGLGSIPLNTPDGQIMGNLIYVSGSGYLYNAGMYIHELGHDLGFAHAASYNCMPVTFVPPTNLDQVNPCFAEDYGDPFDIMGDGGESPTGNYHAQFGSYHENLAGWLDPGQFPTVTTSGTYTISPLEASGSGIMGLNIPRANSGTSFNVEYRQPIGLDTWLANPLYCAKCTITQGASVKLQRSGGIVIASGGGNDTQAIDMTPGSIPFTAFDNSNDTKDGALLPGKTFTDPEYGISITTLSASTSGVTVQVTTPTQSCTHNTPTVVAAPSTQSGAPGATLNYTLTFTNTDSSGCLANTFKYKTNLGQVLAYQYTGPNNWITHTTFTTQATPDIFTLAPGASQNITVSLTTPSSTPVGTYKLWQTSSNPWIESNQLGVPNTFISPLVTVEVTGSTDTILPSAPTNLVATATGAQFIQVSWTPSTDNIGVVGYKVEENNRSLYIVNSNTFTDYYASSNTQYSIAVQAFDANGNLSPATTTSVTTPAQTVTTPPSAPVMTSASTTDTSVTLHWSPSTSQVGIAGYVIDSVSRPLLYLPANSTSVTINNLNTNTQYLFTVQAIDMNGIFSNLYNWPSWYAVTTAFAGETPPSQPTAFYASSATANQVNLAWLPSVGATSYRIYRSARLIATVNGTTTSYTDTNDLYPASTNWYYIVAVDSNGNVSSPQPQYITPLSDVQSILGPPLGYIISTALNNPDTIPPTISMSGVSNNQSVSGAIIVTTNPSDNVGVSKVELYVDGELNSTNSSGPYAFSLDTTKLADGSHWIFARAYDAAGNFTSTSTVTISVNNSGSPTATSGITSTPTIAVSPSPTPALPASTPTLIPTLTPTLTPTVTLIPTPTNTPAPTATPTPLPPLAPLVSVGGCIAGPVSGTNNLTVTWSDTNVNWVNISTDQSNSTYYDKSVPGVTSTSAPTGFTGASSNVSGLQLVINPNTTYYTTVWDGVTNLLSKPTPFSIPLCPTPTISQVDTTSPSVSITSPLNGATIKHGSTITIAANATDNVGVSKVMFYDNNTLLNTQTSAPYTTSWSVPGKPNVTYTLKAVAYDASGNTSSSMVTVKAK